MEAYKSMIQSERGDALLIIDPQVDFFPGGSLAIDGADQDADVIAKLIHTKESVKEIYVTLDSHCRYHIAHSMFWQNKDGEHPNPFTKISAADVKGGRWFASREEHRRHAITYVEALESQGNFELVIWPDHCIIGTPGHSVTPVIAKALEKWEHKHSKPVHYIMKGNNALTEHYSAFAAEVQLKEDPNTHLNTSLIQKLKRHNYVFICGEALSHCVNFSTRDLYHSWGQNSVSQLVLITDASTSVTTFEKDGDDFVDFCRNKRVQTLTSEEVLEESHKQASFYAFSEGQQVCHMMFSPDHKGSLIQSWTPPAGGQLVLSFNCRVPSIPSYKMKHQTILARDLDRKTPTSNDAMLSGVKNFMKDGLNYEGALSVNSEIAQELGLAIYALTIEDTVVDLVDQFGDIFLEQYKAFAIVPSSYTGYCGVRTIATRVFANLAAKGGFFLDGRKKLTP